MVYFLKFLGPLSCGFMLALGLSHVAEAQNVAVNAGELKAGYFTTRQGGQEPGEPRLYDRAEGESKGGRTIKADVLRVEGTDYFVRGSESKEGRLRIDETTLRARNIGPGDRRKGKDEQLELRAVDSIGSRGTRFPVVRAEVLELFKAFD